MLSLPKFKGEKALPATIFYDLFKNEENLKEAEILVAKEFSFNILDKSKSKMFSCSSYDGIEINDFGIEFIEAVKGRLTSLKNQKHNYALFDGLKATAQNKETIAFNKQILEAKRNGLDTKKAFQLGATKSVLLEKIGNHKIIILGSVINKIMQKDKAHCINFNHLINLPDYINNPLAIFKSRNSGYVVLTEIKNELEKPLMVAIHFNKVFKVQDIRSIYSKDNDNIYKEWKENGLLIYENKKRKLFDRFLGLIPKSSNKVLSNNKDNKNNTKNTNFNKNGLKGIKGSKKIKHYLGDFDKQMFEEQIQKDIEKVKTNNGLKAVAKRSSLAHKMANRNTNFEYFDIENKDLSEFLGQIEIKEKYCYLTYWRSRFNENEVFLSIYERTRPKI